MVGTLFQALYDYQQQGFRSFHTPGHKGRQEFFVDLEFPQFDVTELPGLDMLHAPSGVIAKAQQRAAEIFGAEESYFLVNGATCGNQAMLLALGNSQGKVIIERTAHRSVMSGLILSGLQPEYLEPVVHPDFNLPLGYNYRINPQIWKDIQGIHLTYPYYYGTLANLKGIIKERDRSGKDKVVLVDQAHGAHYLSELFPPSALKLGADVVLQSTHKTLSALTQSAMLHVQGERLSRQRLRQALELVQSSSPSYLFLACLERASEVALWGERWYALKEEVDSLHREVQGLVRILGPADQGQYGIHALDWSKILVNTRPLGIKATDCVDYLRKEFRIEPELWDEENILFLLGIGNTPEDVRVLKQALLSLHRLDKTGLPKLERRTSFSSFNPLTKVPPQRLKPREAFLANKRRVRLKDSLGQIAGETISPYPPGIPVIIMGEEITHDVLEYLCEKPGRCLGWGDQDQQMIWIVEGE